MSSAKKEKQAEERTAQRVLLWVCIVVVVGGIVWVAVNSARKTGGTPQRSIDTSVIDDKDWVKGNKDAKLTLVEYSDFQCPACAAYYSVVKKVAYEMGGRVRVVYRNYPLKTTHKNAESAARVAEAAGKQGKFWEMHDMLFEKQTEWSPLDDPKPTFSEYAKKIGLQDGQFLKDINSADVQAKIDSDIKSADQARVNATPTFFLNGVKLEQPQGFEGLKKAIDEASGQ